MHIISLSIIKIITFFVAAAAAAAAAAVTGSSSSAGLAIERLRVRIPAGAAGEFSSPELTLCADSYSMSVPSPVLPQWHVKDPGHSSKSAGDKLHLNTHVLLTQRSRSGLTTPSSRHSVGTYPETSSHVTCQGTLGHSRLSSLSHWN